MRLFEFDLKTDSPLMYFHIYTYAFYVEADNDTLEVLDISWNHIRGKGARAIAEGLRVSSYE